MAAKILQGSPVAEKIYSRLTVAIKRLKEFNSITPSLAVVLVGDNPASEIYVANKREKAKEIGIQSSVHRLGKDASEEALLSLIKQLNADPTVHGILVQLPLQPKMNPSKIMMAIDPAKDVDGFHPTNIGMATIGLPSFYPCTARACLLLAQEVHPCLAGLDVLVIGQSNIVGKPTAQLFLQHHATVTAAHSKTKDIPSLCKRSDIIIVACGCPEMVRGDWIKQGATVIDVGINRIQHKGESRLVGDVAFEEACQTAGTITPVPGGVGKVTIACLMENTLLATHRNLECSNQLT